MIDTSALAANINARKEATEFVEFIGDKPERFWQELIKLAESKLPPKPKADEPDVMTEEQAIRFEASLVPYGKYQDYEVGMVPCEYLCWLIDGNPFTNNLRKYLRTERFKQRQASED